MVVNVHILYLFSHCVSFALLIIDFIVILHVRLIRVLLKINQSFCIRIVSRSATVTLLHGLRSKFVSVQSTFGKCLSTFIYLSIPVNPLMGTLKLQSNGPATDQTVMRRLVHWPLMSWLLHLVQAGATWTGCGSAQSLPRCIPNITAPTHQRPVYQLHIFRCGTIIAFAYKWLTIFVRL